MRVSVSVGSFHAQLVSGGAGPWFGPLHPSVSRRDARLPGELDPVGQVAPSGGGVHAILPRH